MHSLQCIKRGLANFTLDPKWIWYDVNPALDTQQSMMLEFVGFKFDLHDAILLS